MSTTTTNLGLFKYDTSTDAQLAFNINQALNGNWDILDKSTLNGDIITLGSSGTQSLTNNRVHKITCNGNTTFSLPTGSGTEFKEIVVLLYMPTAYSISLGTSVYFGDSAPDMSDSGYYTIIYEYDPIKSTWTVGVLPKDTDGTAPVEYPWTQVFLSSNGTMGGSNCAASCDTHYGSWDAWCAFNGGEATGQANCWMCNTNSGWLKFYSPVALKISSISARFSDPTYPSLHYTSSLTIMGSNDDSNYIDLKSYTPSRSGVETITVNSEDFYKYIRFTASGSYPWIQAVRITASYLG